MALPRSSMPLAPFQAEAFGGALTLSREYTYEGQLPDIN